MTKELKKRVFLVISASEEKQVRFSEMIKKHVSHATVFLAGDGAEGLQKIEKHPPHVLITDFALSRLDAAKLIKNILADRSLKNIAIIIASSIPEEALYLDELVT